MNKSIFFLLLFLGLITSSLAQTTPVKNAFLTCAWENVALRKEAGKTAAFVEAINFGDQVVALDGESFISDERRTYIKVETRTGKVGWVDDFLFIPNAIPVVLLADALIYERPQTPSSATLVSFEAGEIVILGRQSGGWHYVANPNKQKIGWIKDDVPFSRRKLDLTYAQKWAKIQAGPKKNRKSASLALYEEALAQSSEMASFFLSQDTDLLIAVQSKPKDINKKVTVRSPISTEETEDQPYKKESKLVWDTNENSYYTETVETGPAIAVERAIEFPSPFFAYHKSLPLGTRIKMDLPDNRGFVELVVMDRLPANEKAIVALSPACLIGIFGTNNPDNVVISYRNE